jgi:cytochrome c peroxidase/DNA-binding beta-propeller fold protein YncE
MGKGTSLSCALVGVVLGGLVAVSLADAPAGPKNEAKPRLRQPVALVPADDDRWLFTANRRSGSISVLDLKEGRAAEEVDVGRTLADLAAPADGRHLLAVDEGAGELIVLDRRGGELKVSQRVPVGRSPVSVQPAGDGTRCFVASLWSRSLAIVDLGAEQGQKPRVARTIALPFCPRKQLPLPDGERVVVADAFGGRLAVVNVQTGKVESVRTLPGHNIRGLALSATGDQLLLAHQLLNGQTHTTKDEVHWGNLLTNNLRVLSLAEVVAPEGDLLRGSSLLALGDIGAGAADPSAVAVSSQGLAVVASGGTDEVTLVAAKADDWRRIVVGRHPTAVVVGRDGSRAFVANTFGDSISVVDLKGKADPVEMPLGPRAEVSAADRGELLFHDAHLSHDRWLTCQSCHTDGHSNGLLSDTLGDNSFGAPKRVPSLLGVKDTAPYAWNGSIAELKEQLRKSILTTMHGPAPTDAQVADLEAYLQTLAPPPPPQSAEEPVVQRGREVFEKNGCAACHAPPTYTSRKTYNVGLIDEVGNSAFNPPSLRGVAQGGPFFHDGRAATLEEVFTRHRHQLKGELARAELADLLGFLRSL